MLKAKNRVLLNQYVFALETKRNFANCSLRCLASWDIYIYIFYFYSCGSVKIKQNSILDTHALKYYIIFSSSCYWNYKTAVTRRVV